MFYSWWQALYGTYCRGINRLSIYCHYTIIFSVVCITPMLVGKFCGTYPEFASDRPHCSDAGVIFISSKDIMPQGYVLSKPGTYCLLDDIVFTPDKPGRAALTVTGVGITLLLDNVTITQQHGTPNTHGIVIDNALETTVYGGSISGFSGNGVYVKESSAIVLDSITSSHNTGSLSCGFLLENSEALFVVLCTAESNTGIGINVIGKKSFGRAGRVLIEHCTIKSNGEDQDISFS